MLSLIDFLLVSNLLARFIQYTPVASFTLSGHFYSYDNLHLTQLARYLDVARKGNLANQVHHHAFETLVQLVIDLPRSDPERSNLRCNPTCWLI
ncbi:hypothetical protein OG21DRAFT_623975 [Imleria badia]|nr:hypothetical protein OG21DRAFT_623975 [Imleria badia]